MAAEVKYFMIVCVAWCCISMPFSAAIPATEEPIYPYFISSNICPSMVPELIDYQPSATLSPYIVRPSKNKVAPGETIHVSVSGVDGAKFKGIYLQARVVGAGVEAVGKFPLNNQLINSAIRVSSCPPGSENAISYVSRDAVNSLVLNWKAPESATRKIYFRATVVERFQNFWIDVKSEPITITDSTQEI